MTALIGTFLMGLLAGFLYGLRLNIRKNDQAARETRFNITYHGLMTGRRTDIDLEDETITLNHN